MAMVSRTRGKRKPRCCEAVPLISRLTLCSIAASFGPCACSAACIFLSAIFSHFLGGILTCWYIVESWHFVTIWYLWVFFKSVLHALADLTCIAPVDCRSLAHLCRLYHCWLRFCCVSASRLRCLRPWPSFASSVAAWWPIEPLPLCIFCSIAPQSFQNRCAFKTPPTAIVVGLKGRWHQARGMMRRCRQ